MTTQLNPRAGCQSVKDETLLLQYNPNNKSKRENFRILHACTLELSRFPTLPGDKDHFYIGRQKTLFDTIHYYLNCVFFIFYLSCVLYAFFTISSLHIYILRFICILLYIFSTILLDKYKRTNVQRYRCTKDS